MTYRGFTYLHSRVLLHVQDELNVLERSLDAFDKGDELRETRGQRTGLRSKRLDLRLSKDQPGETRQEILEKIKQKLLEYGMILSCMPSEVQHDILTHQ